jgi:hypothetical protein
MPIAVLLTVALTAVSSTETLAQGNEQKTPQSKKAPLIRRRSKTQTNFDQYWTALLQSPPCSPTPGSTCRYLAAAAVNQACAQYALFYQKESTGWSVATFALVLASAGFTGAGAAATLAGSTTVPKVFSSLGGTTGLGAVTSTVKANQSTDEAAISAVNAEIAKFNDFMTTATTDDVLNKGSGFVALCASAAPPPTSSSGLTITTSSLPKGKVGTAYSGSLVASGGTTPYKWSLSTGTLPSGLNLTASSGLISGTPTAQMSSSPLTFKVTDSSKPPNSQTVSLTLTIDP